MTDVQALEKTHYGLDAEVLKEVYPDLIYESQEGDLCINYTEMIPLLVQSVSELRAQVVSLQGAQTYNVRARNGNETGIGGNALDVPALEQNDRTLHANDSGALYVAGKREVCIPIHL